MLLIQKKVIYRSCLKLIHTLTAEKKSILISITYIIIFYVIL